MSSIIKSHADPLSGTARAFAIELPVLALEPEPVSMDEELQPEAMEEVAEPEIPEPDPHEIAAQIVADAEEQARAIVAAAEASAAVAREAARSEGYAEGEAQARSDWTRRLEELNEQAGDLMRERDAYFASAEPQLAALSLDIARKVLKQELAISPEAVLSVVRACIHRLRDKEAHIRVNPKDLDTVRSARDSFLSIADGSADIEIVSDRRVGQGGCIVETPSGNIDARLDTQLEHIEQVLLTGMEAPRDVAS